MSTQTADGVLNPTAADVGTMEHQIAPSPHLKFFVEWGPSQDLH
jgi:hypothetical protein